MKSFIVLFTFLLTFNLQGQVDRSNPIQGMLIKTKRSSTLSKIEGTPFLNDEFQRGEIIIEGKEPIDAFMRYDVNNEIIEIKLDPSNEEVFYMEPNLKAEFRFGGNVYNIHEITIDGGKISGIFIEHYTGDNYSFLEKPTIEIIPAEKARTGYDEDEPAKIKIESKFFIIDDRGEVKEVEVKHRDIRKAFDWGKAKDYLKDNRIRNIEDLKVFVSFLDENAE